MPPVGVESGCIGALLLVAALGAAAGTTRHGTRLVYGLSLAVSLIAAAQAAAVLLGGGTGSTLALPLGLPGTGMHLRLDALAAVFLTVIHVAGGLASLYALGYGRHEPFPERVLPYYPAFIAAMSLVVLADDAFTFLLAWEAMSLVSWALVVAHHQEPENLRAGRVYLLMASFGTLCLLFAFGLLAGPGGAYAFAEIRAAQPSAGVVALVLVLTLVGAGSKAGLVPLHVWLPLAHPAAPSHVSAVLSGVMTKIGVYGFVRVVFDLMHAASPGSGMLVLAVGGVTAALGVLYAAMQDDLKRLLAYSSVENIGIVFVGLGLALAFQGSGMPWAAALALTAALLHVFNHSLFKSLLFFGAGAVLTATGRRDLERLGGLVHRMPVTAVVVLVGCAAIAALPPLNGFASEWLTFQAILASPQVPHLGLKFLVPVVGALLAFAAALAAACFVKLYGIVFLGRPRSAEAETAREVDAFSRAAMLILAALCLLAGVLPGLLVDALAPATQLLVGARLPAQATQPWLSLVPLAQGRSSYNGLVILAFLVCSASLTALVVHRFATRATRRSALWDCGYPFSGPATQYGGSSFVMPIRRVFAARLFGAVERLDMPRPGETRPGHFYLRMIDPAWRYAYGPLGRAVAFAAERANELQFLTIRRYLTLVVSALIVLLVVVAAWR